MRRLSRDDDEYRKLLQHETEAVLIFGQTLEDCNAQALSLLGCERDDLVGKRVTDFVPPAQRAETVAPGSLHQRLAAALSGLPQSFQCELCRFDAECFDALVHLEALELDSGRRVLARVRDVSRLRHVEQDLLQAEASLRQVLENTSAMVCVKDTAGRYVFVNSHFCALVGKPESEIKGRFSADLFPPDLAERLRANDQRVLDARSPIEVEEQLRVGDEQRSCRAIKFPLLNRRNEPYALCSIITDVTGRKRAEAALHSAALAVSTAGTDVVFQELTRYLATALGVECAFIAVCDRTDNGHVRTLAVYSEGGFEENIEYALAGTVCGTVVGRDFRFVPAGVRQLYPQDRMFKRLAIEGYAAYPLNDADGRPLGLISALSRRPLDNRNLTESMLKIFAGRAASELERKRAEDARRVSEASYRAIFEASEDAIFIHDWDTGAIVDVNPKACEAYGWSCEELKRLTASDISSGEHPYTAAESARLIELAKQGPPVHFEWHRRNQDGSLHWDEVYLKTVVLAGEKRIVAFTREITERKLAEEGLRASEEQYRAIFNASVDGMAVLDAQGCIVDANPAYLLLLGYSRNELIGRKAAALLAPGSDDVCSALVQTVGDGESFQRECQVERNGGEIFDVDVGGVRMHYQGRPHLLAILRDITARKRAEAERGQLEAQLRQAQKMEAIGHLTGGIAHDFNNILTSIMGYIVLATERVADAGDSKSGKYLEQAHLAATRARDLIQQMLTFSRGQRGEPRPLSLPPLIRETVKLLRSTLPATVELETELSADVPGVLLDPVQVEQVLLNLCINARDAVHGVGSIGVAVRLAADVDHTCASCRKPVQGRMVELSVHDTGPGIAPEVMDRMFEPFFSTKETGKGSGMGLSTVHGIVHEHGGHVVVDSQPGAGTRFRILFPPLAGEPAGSRKRSRSASGPRRRALRLAGRVLVVDDEEMVGEFMGELLQSWGLHVTVKHSPLDAQKALAEDPARFDLVVTDQSMPKLTGLELARRLLELRPGLPVVLYTGYSDTLTPDELKRCGVRALVRKPVEPATLFSVLRAHLPRPPGGSTAA
jgi:PAS domain S-box-containing protein